MFTTFIYTTYVLFDNSVPIKSVVYQFDQCTSDIILMRYSIVRQKTLLLILSRTTRDIQYEKIQKKDIFAH